MQFYITVQLHYMQLLILASSLTEKFRSDIVIDVATLMLSYMNVKSNADYLTAPARNHINI